MELKTAIARVMNYKMLGIAKENARRIAACVNACAGLSTEALERLGTLDRANVARDVENNRVRQQRDELLEAVRTAADQIRCCDYTPARSTLLQAIAAFEQAAAL